MPPPVAPGERDRGWDDPGVLDDRVPVASDMPMIDAVIGEVPNPRHPFGMRGVGEVPVVPPMAALANAIHAALDRDEPQRLAAE
jgi:CO/xanthine dehydrogenase Mo-binding subunit